MHDCRRARISSPTAYDPKALENWALRATLWAAGGQPDDLPLADTSQKPEKRPRNVFVYIIHEGKLRAPQGAMAFMELCDRVCLPKMGTCFGKKSRPEERLKRVERIGKTATRFARNGREPPIY